MLGWGIVWGVLYRLEMEHQEEPGPGSQIQVSYWPGGPTLVHALGEGDAHLTQGLWLQVCLPGQLAPSCAHPCSQEPAFGMLTVPLRTPLTRLAAEHHAEAVSIFKLVWGSPT